MKVKVRLSGEWKKKEEEGEIVSFTVDLFQTACRLNHYPPIRLSEELQGGAAHLCSALSTPVQRAAPPSRSSCLPSSLPRQSRDVSLPAQRSDEPTRSLSLRGRKTQWRHPSFEPQNLPTFGTKSLCCFDLFSDFSERASVSSRLFILVQKSSHVLVCLLPLWLQPPEPPEVQLLWFILCDRHKQL